MKTIIDYADNLKVEIYRIQLKASLHTLKQVDDVIAFHNNDVAEVEANIIINIFGLLQSLFVAIDALYNVVLTVTNSKSYININQNKTLNNLKHIRNDIVGHPIDRYYGSDGVGYSVIDTDNLDEHFFTYITYIKTGNKIERSVNEIDLNVLKAAYIKEKDIIIDRISNFINKKAPRDTLYNDLLKLYHNYNETNLKVVKDLFTNVYGNLDNHRFLWRVQLIEFLLKNIIVDKEVTNYLIKGQIIKLFEITKDLEQNDFKIPFVKLPKTISKTYKYLNKNNEFIPLIKNLHDSNNPYFKGDLNYLLNNVNNYAMLSLLNTIKNTKDNETIYLIGQVFKNYRTK